MNTAEKFFRHLHTVNKHRFIVCRLCFKMGLYAQGLKHDLSKYSWVEFSSGVKYYQGNRSPIDAERKTVGYSEGWLHHQGHNRHHWQYWMDFTGKGIIVQEIPLKYVKEMVADRIAACMVYQRDKYHPSSALEFLNRSPESHYLPRKTYDKLYQYLTWVAEYDLDTALKMVRDDNDY